MWKYNKKKNEIDERKRERNTQEHARIYSDKQMLHKEMETFFIRVLKREMSVFSCT